MGQVSSLRRRTGDRYSITKRSESVSMSDLFGAKEKWARREMNEWFSCGAVFLPMSELVREIKSWVRVCTSQSRSMRVLWVPFGQ